MNQSTLETLLERVLGGGSIDEHEARALAEYPDREAVYAGAEAITRHFGKPVFNPCSIINARAGQCSENCKWCAQSGHYHTDSDVHGIVSEEDVLIHARAAKENGVKRFSQVASGRAVKGAGLKKICSNNEAILKETGLFVCSSLGLLNKAELEELWASGARRYHCNLETARSYFPELCTTHTIDDKLATILAAREVGFQICSGGIIGMGESRAQRIEFAFNLKEAHPDSIPINVLCPIPGTPLENTPPLSEDEILLTVALFRWIHPRVELRFAGGRMQLSRDTQLRAMRIGINGAIIGDLLTTIGSRAAEDRELIEEAGYMAAE